MRRLRRKVVAMVRAVLVTERGDGSREQILIIGLSAINVVRLARGKPVKFALNARERECTDVMVLIGETEEQIERDLKAIVEEHA